MVPEAGAPAGPFRLASGRGGTMYPLYGVPMAKLYFYYSTMNAGKTTTLLQSAYNYHERGMRTLLLVPATDTRVGDGVVGSRIGLRAKGRRVDFHANLFEVASRDIADRGP